MGQIIDKQLGLLQIKEPIGFGSQYKIQAFQLDHIVSINVDDTVMQFKNGTSPGFLISLPG